MGDKDSQFQDVSHVLLRFNKTIPLAKDKYRAFICAGLGDPSGATKTLIETIRKSNQGSICMHNAGSGVIGDPDFVRSAFKADEVNRRKVARYRPDGVHIRLAP